MIILLTNQLPTTNQLSIKFENSILYGDGRPQHSPLDHFGHSTQRATGGNCSPAAPSQELSARNGGICAVKQW